MKNLIIITTLILLAASSLPAGTPTRSVDTLNYSSYGQLQFLATWNFNTSATADTLTAPRLAKSVEIFHDGAATGDTILVSLAQSGTLGYGVILSTRGQSYTLTVPEPLIGKIYVKAQAGTGRVRVRARN